MLPILTLCLLLAPAPEGRFPDSQYARYTWQTFLALPALRDTLDLANPDYSLLNAAVFYVTNRERQRSNRPPLEFDPRLRDMADHHAAAMARYRFVSHVNPHDAQSRSFEQRAGRFQPHAGAENVASEFLYDYEPGSLYYRKAAPGGYRFYDQQDRLILRHTYLSFAETLVAGWMNSRGHRANILHPSLRTLGCAVRLSAGETGSDEIPLAYAVQNFGWRR
ncbi:MAG: CAP domain-containing protein [Bacteroidia bacterium]|nr:CAP domain-containing protein [Bacteroidia bacterium]